MEKHSLLETSTKGSEFKTEHFGVEWSFEDAYSEQLKTIEEVFSSNNVVLLTGVHKSVYTLGNSFKNKTKELSSNFVQTDRGGKIMYHGPGQLTFYPIFKLNEFFSGPKAYLKFMFDLCIKHFQDEYGLELTCRNNGLWSESGKKVGFVGLRVKKGITSHGLSLNYNTDLSAFLKHSPCDISGEQAGNLFTDPSCFDLDEEALKISKLFYEGLKSLTY